MDFPSILGPFSKSDSPSLSYALTRHNFWILKLLDKKMFNSHGECESKVLKLAKTSNQTHHNQRETKTLIVFALSAAHSTHTLGIVKWHLVWRKLWCVSAIIRICLGVRLAQNFNFKFKYISSEFVWHSGRNVIRHDVFHANKIEKKEQQAEFLRYFLILCVAYRCHSANVLICEWVNVEYSCVMATLRKIFILSHESQ